MMKACEWADEGKVLSFAKLQAVPEGADRPHDLVLVQLAKKGPKIVCWTTSRLEVEDEVSVVDNGGRYFCQLLERSKRSPNP